MKKYSFYTLDKSEVLGSENIDDTIDDNDLETVKIYTYHDEKIIEEYSFETGDMSLYRDNGDNTLSLLYETFIDDDGNNIVFIYTPHGLYSACFNNGNLLSVRYSTSETFEKVQKLSHFCPKKLLDYFTSCHSLPLVIAGKTLKASSTESKEYLNDFKKLFIRYSTASKYIPANCLINGILDIAYHYISTGQIDNASLLDNYIKLQNFQEACSDSIYIISDFVDNCSKVHYRKFCESLEKISNNTSNLIDLYLDDLIDKIQR